MVTERDTIGFPQAAGIPPGSAMESDSLQSADTPAELTDAPAQQPGSPAPGASQPGPADAGPADLLASIFEAVRKVADSSERYHARAEQREGVIDHLHSEVDRLRRGERRGLLRPLLVEFCRLRNDLLRQADGLPSDFDAAQARLLLCSYAESVEIALEDSGVVTFAPSEGDSFEPRMHRKVGGEPTSDPAVAGRVARVQRSGYLDVDTSIPIAPAEVVLFAAASAGPAEEAPVAPHNAQPDLMPADPGSPGSVSATDERKAL